MSTLLCSARPRGFVPLLVLAAITLSVARTALAGTDHVPIGYVKVDYVTQPPGRPVVIRILIKAPRELTVRVGYTILDRRGKRIYEQTSRPFKTHFRFDVSSAVLRWPGKDANGRLVPTLRGYYVEPFAIDVEDRDGDDRAGVRVRGRRYFFPLQ